MSTQLSRILIQLFIKSNFFDFYINIKLKFFLYLSLVSNITILSYFQ